jgi:iron complex outermembrane recepter protein
MKITHTRLIPLSVAIGLAATSMPQLAGAVELEEIVVTAQKREQSMQDVPISLNAVTSAKVEQMGIFQAEGLIQAVPSLNVTHNGTAPSFYLRGIGTVASQPGQDSAIATFVDGVYQGGLDGGMFSFNNIERVEVLKGPQGTLFGRNATGGAINIVTRDPSFEPEMKAEVGYGNLDTLEGNLYVTGGLTDRLAADFAAYYSDMGEGFGKNVTTGGEANQRRDRAFRGKLLFQASDDTRITASAAHSYTGGNDNLSYRPVDTAYALLRTEPGTGGTGAGFWDIISDEQPGDYVKSTNGYLKLEHDFSFGKLTSITGYNKIEALQDGDLDTTENFLVHYMSVGYAEQYTQEIQLASPDDSDLQWVTGVFYLDAEAGYGGPGGRALDIFGPIFTFDPVFPLWGVSHLTQQDTQSIAVFGQMTYPLTDRLNITLGARYTQDERDFTGETSARDATNSFDIPFGVRTDSVDTDEPTWRLALDYQVNDDVMAFISYNRGFKSGSYNTTAPYDPPTEPEILDAYEIGLKSTLLDNRLRLNMAAFFYDYSEIQLSKISGAAQTILNAAEAEVIGFDMDFDAVLTDNLSLTGGIALLDTEYKELSDAPVSFPAGPGAGVGFVDCVANPAGCDLSGNDMILAADITYNVGFLYSAPVADGTLDVAGNYFYNDGYATEVDNRLQVDSYGLFNANIKWTAPSGNYYVKLWGRNLTDEEYLAQYISVFTADLGAAADGRTYGVAVGANF